MATFTVTTTQYITQLTGKTGGDTYNINGGTLIIDADSRFAPNASQNTGAIGNLTVSATAGGNLTVTTDNIRIVKLSGASGIIPAYGTVVTQGAATGVLLCCMQERHGDLIALGGSGIPVNGYIKVRMTSGTFTAGPIVIGTATATVDSEEQGWIIIAGEETRTHSHSRLGSMNFSGHWFEVGTTNGLSSQQIFLPFYFDEGLIAYPGVEVETAPGSGVYQFFPNAGNKFTSTNCSTDTRSSFCYISDFGILRFGLGLDSQPAGYLPVSGCKVRIPSIITQNCTSANRSVNSQPNGTMGTRYESAFTQAGGLNVSKVTGAWYWNVVQAYSVYIRDFHVCDNILLGECATSMDIDNLHQGLSNNATDFNSNGIVIQQSYNGGTIGTMSWLRANSSATSSYSAILVNLYGGWTIDKLRGGCASVASSVSGALYLNTCGPMTINEITTFSKRVLVQGAESLRISKFTYADNCVGTTGTTAQSRAIEIVGLSKSVDVQNIQNWTGVANCHPYLALMFCNTVAKATLRNCGTAAAPYNAGTANIMAYIWDDGGNNDIIKIQRNWTTALRLGLHGGTNTSKRLTSVNNYQVDASKTIGPQQLDSVVHGNRFNGGGVPQSYSAVYGNCMWDGFTGDTTTRAALIFVEKSAANTLAYAITAGTPKFTGAGALVMQIAGDQIEYTWQWRILGWNGLNSMAAQGTNQTTNHSYEYALDKDGTGYGAWKTLSNANLSAETGIDPVVGFGVKLRITCTTSSTTNQITSLRFDGYTTLALQNVALYPLDIATLTITGLQVDSTVAVFTGTPTPGQAPVALSTTNATSTISLPYDFDNAYPTYTVRIRKAGWDTIEIPYTNLIETTIPVSQQENKDGFGVPIYGRGQGITSSYVTVDSANLRINIGNTRATGEDVYDKIALYQAGTTGIMYPEALRFDGRDLLLLGAWRFKRLNTTDLNAGIDALPTVDGFPALSPDDEINGSVDFKARDIRTYDTSGNAVMTPQDIAQAVRAEIAVELSRLDVNVSTRALETTAKTILALSA